MPKPLTHRRTSSYLLELPPANRMIVHKEADNLIAALPVTLDASGVANGRAFVRFRCASDEEATEIARQTTSRGVRLSVGYGVHQRVVFDDRRS